MTSTAHPLTARTLHALDSRIVVPKYDRDRVGIGIVHFGVGNFHRAHQAIVVDDLLNAGHMEWGICGVGLLPQDKAMRDALRDQDHLYSLTTMAPGGRETVRIVGSIVDFLFAPEDPEAVLERLTDPATRIVSLTITEGGYLQHPAEGTFDPELAAVVRDARFPDTPTTAFGYIVAALRRRARLGIAPFAVMSCDNIRSNGEVTRQATVGLAALTDPEFAEWISSHVDFPNSMVDRITPVTAPADHARLADKYDLEDERPVRSEEFFQWVLEDFPRERPAYESAGVEIVDDVVPFELMKLRLLNASHQVLAHVGLLAGHRLVHEAAADELLTDLLWNFWRREAIPTLATIPGIEYDAYCEQLLSRFRNGYVVDTLDRLAADAANRISVFLLPVLREALVGGRPGLISALTIGAWARRLSEEDAIDMSLERGSQAFSWAGELGADPRFVQQQRTIAAALREKRVRAVCDDVLKTYASDARELDEVTVDERG